MRDQDQQALPRTLFHSGFPTLRYGQLVQEVLDETPQAFLSEVAQDKH